MGLKFTWGKLSVTLRSICMYIDNVYLTPDNVIATKCYPRSKSSYYFSWINKQPRQLLLWMSQNQVLSHDL